MPRLRLVTDEPEIEPPAPLPIDAWRSPGRDDTRTARDPIASVEEALSRVQSGLDDLSAQLESEDPFPFPGRRDDDGPYAA